MANQSWKASSFLAKTSYAPIQFAVLGVFIFVLTGIVVAAHYEVDYRVVVTGEVVSKSGERDVTSPTEGVLELRPLMIGQSVSANEVTGYIKIPFTNHNEVSEILIVMHKMLESVSGTQLNSKHTWPKLDSGNAYISEQLLESKKALEEYNNEIQNKIKLIDLKTKNLIENKRKLQSRVRLLSNSKNRSLTEGLIEEQKKEIRSIDEELVKVENDHLIKTSEMKSQLLSSLKNSYLKIVQFKDLHVVRTFAPGRISKILTTNTQQVKKDQIILVVSPNDEEFEFKLRIPTYDAGKISTHLSLRAEVDSYAYQRFGMFTGSVSRLDRILTQTEGQSFYYAYTTIQKPDPVSRQLASTIQLLPGMKVKAHIILKKVTLTQLIYEKLFFPYGNF